ncbi:hypothetical protein D3C86_1487190 [compost metagenome]
MRGLLHLLRCLQDALACRCEGIAIRRAKEQGGVQCVLKRGNAPSYRSLVQPHYLGGLAQRAFTLHRKENPCVIPIHAVGPVMRFCIGEAEYCRTSSSVRNSILAANGRTPVVRRACDPSGTDNESHHFR